MDSFRDHSKIHSDASTSSDDDLPQRAMKSTGKRIIMSDSEEDEDEELTPSHDGSRNSFIQPDGSDAHDDDGDKSYKEDESTSTNEQHASKNEEDQVDNEGKIEEEVVLSDAEPDEISFIHEFLSDGKFNSTTVQDQKLVLEGSDDEIETSLVNNSETKPIVSDVSDVIEASFRLSTSATSNIINSTEEQANSSDESVKLVSNKVEEIIISSDSEEDECRTKPELPVFNQNVTLKQPTLHELLNKEINTPSSKRQISRLEYVNMKQKLDGYYIENRRLQQALKTIQLNQLPDKGHALQQKQRELENIIKEQEGKFENIEVKNEQHQPTPLTWKGIETAATEVQPRTFGKQALQTYNNEKALTLDRLHHLHGSLKTCPTAETLAEDPRGLQVELMQHQKHALAWLLWRENQKPAGGILADDMGLGKTLTMISLLCANKQIREEAEDQDEQEESDIDDDAENEDNPVNYKYKGGTLVVCPASLLGQWVNEVEDKLQHRMLSVTTYHGPKRETKAKRLSKFDMVVTTYAICQSEGDSDTALYRIKWDRIILDEAHQIRNHKSKTSLAVFRLGSKRRWALTGTPVHNKELDLFALLKFLRCSPFDDIAVFKRWISQKSSGGHQRLHTVLSSLLLRRTKEQLKEMEQLTCLPEREWQLLEITMDKHEMEVYQKILLFSKTLFGQYLHQRAEKNADNMDMDYHGKKWNDPSNEYYKMHQKLVRMNKLPEVKSSDILVLLLRLRQICCHPSLITAMLDNVADLGGDDADTADVSVDLLDQLNKLNINDEEDNEANFDGIAANPEGVGLAEASRGLLNPSNPIFHKDRQSAKLRAVLELLQEKILPSDDKAIIVSQWTSLLHLLVPHLEALNINYCQLDGTIQVKNRADIVKNFNDPRSDIKIMLLSLTAGGVGLNLVGANHLAFLDLHWNPQLEMQAQDRIYRVGQKKKVHIYKFMTVETIEQRIKTLQDKKKEMAEAMLKGAKMQHSKLSLDDLKMLFNM